MDDRDQLASLASLVEPLRRRLYRHVASSSASVSRDDAAQALGVSRSVAAFHLDKLVDAGLLEVEYRRPPGRGGPGAGRPAKLYRRGSAEVGVSVPARHYDLAASLLARALEEADDRAVPANEAVRRVARERGRGLVKAASLPARILRRSPRARLTDVLEANGYEPRHEGRTLFMENCPFRALTDEHRELICTMNHALVEGVLQALQIPTRAARLDPCAGGCCVKIDTAVDTT